MILKPYDEVLLSGHITFADQRSCSTSVTKALILYEVVLIVDFSQLQIILNTLRRLGIQVINHHRTKKQLNYSNWNLSNI